MARLPQRLRVGLEVVSPRLAARFSKTARARERAMCRLADQTRRSGPTGLTRLSKIEFRLFYELIPVWKIDRVNVTGAGEMYLVRYEDIGGEL